MSIKTATLRLQLVDDVTGKAGVISKAMAGLNKSISGLDRSIAQTRGQFVGAVATAAAAAAALVAPVKAAMELEDGMADIAKVSNFSPEGIKQLRGEILGLSKEIPLSAREIANLAAELSAAGTADGDLLRMTRLVARTATAFGMTGAEAGENLGKIRAALGLTVEETERYADAINALSDGTASKAGDLTDFSRRMGSLGKMYGYTNEQVLAFGSASISAGATSEQAATGMQAVGRALTRGAAATKAQREAYTRLGLNTNKVAKGMAKNALETTELVFQKLRELPAHERAAYANMLFGDEARTMMPLIMNTDLLADSLAILADKAKVNGSVMREFMNRIGTTSGKLAILRNKMVAAGIAFGNALLPAIGRAAEVLGPWIDKAAKWIEQNEQLVGRLTMAAGAVLGLRVAMLGGKLAFLLFARDVLKAGRGLVKFAAWAKTAAGASIALQAALGAASGQKLGFWGKLGTGLKGIVVATPGLGLLAKSLLAVGAALAGISAPVWGLIAAGALAVAAAGAAIYRHWDMLTAIFRGVARAVGEQLAPAFEAIRPAISWLAPIGRVIASGWRAASDALSGFIGWVGQFFGRNHLDASQKAAWEQYGHDLTTGLINGVKAGLAALPGIVAGIPRAIYGAVGLGGLFDAGVRLAGDLVNGIHSGLSSLASAASRAVSQLVAAFHAGNLYAVGAQMIQSLINGAKAKVAELIAWISSLPGMIKSAIGRIDLSNIISWPSRPSWLGGGGGSTSSGSGSAPSASPHGESAPKVDGARAAGGPVKAGHLYEINERGQELFAPGADGNIIPNHKVPQALGGAAPAPMAAAAAPAAGDVISPTQAPVTQAAGPVTISIEAPTVTMNLSIHGVSDDALARRVRKAVDDGLSKATGALDSQLRRSAQIAFRSMRYGEA